MPKPEQLLRVSRLPKPNEWEQAAEICSKVIVSILGQEKAEKAILEVVQQEGRRWGGVKQFIGHVIGNLGTDRVEREKFAREEAIILITYNPLRASVIEIDQVMDIVSRREDEFRKVGIPTFALFPSGPNFIRSKK